MIGETDAADERDGAVFRVRAATVTVTRGPDAPRSERVDRPTFVIGSGEGSDMRLTDTTVSRAHVRLTLDERGVHLRDGGSRNGTWVGAMKVGEAFLTADTNIEIGKTTLAIRLEANPIDLPMSEHGSFGGAIGQSGAMRHLFALLERAARSDVSVLLEGESGVGKEVLARGIHATSPRADGPFVAVDCGAIPANLIESELFGHERGAFTGAQHARIGVFEQAHHGTLFLDEIGELPIDLQPKLLRALETREVRPLGGRSTRKIDVRLIAATNRRLAEAAAKNEFRRDLFYRLAVARVTIPALRDRPEDIAPIARAFLRSITNDPAAELPADLMALLEGYAWPGNVRELRNVIERFAVLGERDARALFDGSQPRGPSEDLSHLPFNEARRIAIERFERQYVPSVLEKAGGVVVRAAEMAQVARPSFYRMLDRLRVPNDGED